MLKSNEFSDDFGFTEEEVDNALTYFELDSHKDEVRDYYDGYIIGDTTDICNPWSITNYLKDKEFGTYWTNTSSNDIINIIVEKKLIQKLKMNYKDYLKMKKLK